MTLLHLLDFGLELKRVWWGQSFGVKISPWRGRFHSLNFDKTIGPEYLDDFVIFLLQHKLTYSIFLHDENYFILNENQIALPTVINEKSMSLIQQTIFIFSHWQDIRNWIGQERSARIILIIISSHASDIGKWHLQYDAWYEYMTYVAVTWFM